MYKLTVNNLSDFTVKRVAVQYFRIQGAVILSILESSLCSGFRFLRNHACLKFQCYVEVCVLFYVCLCACVFEFFCCLC